MASISDHEILQVAKHFNGKSFSTYNFILKFQDTYPSKWRKLENQYGPGGRGSGKHFTAFSRVAQLLRCAVNKGWLKKFQYKKAPEGWGSPLIRYWKLPKNVSKIQAK